MSSQVDAHWHTERRDKMAADGFRILLLLNGGAAIALMAFLQAVWDKPGAPPLMPWLLGSLGVLSVGALFSGALYFLRMQTSWAHQLAGRNGKKAQCVEDAVTILSLVLFVVGIGITVTGMGYNLPNPASVHCGSASQKAGAGSQGPAS